MIFRKTVEIQIQTCGLALLYGPDENGQYPTGFALMVRIKTNEFDKVCSVAIDANLDGISDVELMAKALAAAAHALRREGGLHGN